MNRPFFAGNESTYVQSALASAQTAADGPFTRACRQILERELCAPCLLTTSGTHALELAASLLDFQPGAEVIVPTFTFTSTASAFMLRGAVPVFADIHPATLNIDETLIEPLITPRTRAIVVMHYSGVACEMDPILDISRRTGIPVVEDNAHSLFAAYRGKPLGTFGALAAHSFHETKNFTCGEGGALTVNEATFAARAEILVEKGTDRKRYFRGEVDKYTWVDLGSSYGLSDLLAAYLLAQLEARPLIENARRALFSRYCDALAPWAAAHQVRLPVIPAHCDCAPHLFHLVMPSSESRSALTQHLRAAGIASAFHYSPLHISAMGRSFGGRDGQCPVAESVSGRLLRLPFYTSLTEAEQGQVIDRVLSFTPVS